MNLKYLFLFSILILVYICGNILSDFNKSLEKSAKIQKETSSILAESQLPKKIKPFKAPVIDPKPSPSPEAEYSVETVSEARLDDNNGVYHSPDYEEAEEMWEEPVVEENSVVGICHTYLYLCKESEIMFGYKANPEDEQSRLKGSQIIQCVTNVNNCMDDYQEISLEEESLIIEQAKMQKGVQ